MTVDAEKAAVKTYDYIIVGGGTAGCPLAATLSQNYSVLVLERGDSPYGNPDIEEAKLFGKPFSETNKYTSIAQGFVSEDGVQLLRARVLGGATAINAGFYSRASLEYIRNMRWDEKLVNQSYEWVEKQNAFKPNRLSHWSSTFQNALMEAKVLPYNGYTVDHVEGTKISASTFDNNGKRHTAADLLKSANPQNIVLLLNVTASRILFHSGSGKPKVYGVEFMSANNGMSYKASLNKLSGRNEVILSAGSLGSPQLLLLSGIGPSKHLKQFNIPVLLDLPLVGKGVQDNPGTIMSVESPIPLESSSIQVVAILNDSQVYIESASPVQQVPVNGTSGATRTQYTGRIFEKLAFPKSRGELRLQSRDPRDNPSVRYNYFSHPHDLPTCMQAVKVIAKLSETASVQNFTFKNMSSGAREFKFVGQAIPQSTSGDEVVAKFCHDALVTVWHFHGGCHIGSVINRRHKVKGVRGLRIVDGSTFEDCPGTNPQATTMMLGRYTGLKILEERSR
ncbi:hypothetical protein KI387_014029 [Taxus chinensis]|uniref:Glucose-methanol-choline oxidoreductase N-terminal domain-containing protein n=1 Tax=Taxus chinensis TaxID=29808 RepID=A0AA38CMK9_TAXCH|nr:hypothetical protein KI387_014029 [Taxus chinensis]